MQQKERVDLRCEFELTKYTNLAELQPMETGLVWDGSPLVSPAKDSNFEWFQETHNFRLMTRQQFELKH